MKAVMWFIAAYAAAAPVTPAFADPLITDRPDFVEAGDVVGAGRVQVETSVGVTRAGENEVALPTLLRVGVLETLELRVETEGPVLKTRAGTTAWALPEVGLKWHAADNTGAVPGIGILLHDDLSPADYLRPSLRSVLEWDLPAAFGLGVMPGVACGGFDTRRAACTALLGVVAGYAVSDSLRLFVESANEEWTARQVGVSTFDTGLSYLITQDMQVDTAAYFGLTEPAADVGLTVGYSVRY